MMDYCDWWVRGMTKNCAQSVPKQVLYSAHWRTLAHTHAINNLNAVQQIQPWLPE